MTIRTTIAAAMIASTMLARGSAAPAVLTPPVAIDSPAGPNSADPQLTVAAKGALLSWIERDGDTATLKFAERQGAAWSAPRIVASGRDWFVNWADVPSVIRLADNSLYAHWLQKSGADTYAYDVRLSRSTDDGRTWSPSITPHHDGTKTEHGFASLYQMPGAGLGLVWLDGRAMTPGHEGHGDMSVRSAVFDKAGTQTSESSVDLRVCECCPTTAAVTADGPIVAYRDRGDTEVRDIYVSRFVGGAWTAGAPVHRDNWQIAACPVNGPALSTDGRVVALAWFSAAGGDGHSYLAFSQNSGQSFGEPIRLDDATALGRVDVALLADGSAVATWIEFANGKADFRMRHVASDGTRSPAVTVSGLSANRASGYPRMARFGNELTFAWTDSSTPTRVRTARMPLPSGSSTR